LVANTYDFVGTILRYRFSVYILLLFYVILYMRTQTKVRILASFREDLSPLLKGMLYAIFVSVIIGTGALLYKSSLVSQTVLY